MTTQIQTMLDRLEAHAAKVQQVMTEATPDQFVIWTVSSMCVDPGQQCSVGADRAPYFSAESAYRQARIWINKGKRCQAIPRPEALQMDLDSVRETIQQLRAMRDEPQEASQ